MGSASVFRVFKGDREAVKKAFAEAQDICRHENGHSYSGGIGMFHGLEFHDKEFASRNEAEDYVYDKGDKWGPAIAVRFKNGQETEASKKKHEFLKKHYEALRVKLSSLYTQSFTQFKNAKSKTAGCKACGSKLNREVVCRMHGGLCTWSEVRCICKKSLYGDTTKKRITAMEAKVEESKKAYEDYKPTFAVAETAWAVGGYVSC